MLIIILFRFNKKKSGSNWCLILYILNKYSFADKFFVSLTRANPISTSIFNLNKMENFAYFLQGYNYYKTNKTLVNYIIIIKKIHMNQNIVLYNKLIVFIVNNFP